MNNKRDDVMDFDEGGVREWLETNGRGAYAMGSVSGGLMSQSHSLLTFPLRHPDSSKVVRLFQTVNRLEESVFVGHACVGCLSPNQSGPVCHLENFHLDPFPVWMYSLLPVKIEKSFFLRYGEDTGVTLYRHVSGPEILLKVRPLLIKQDSGSNHPACAELKDRVSVTSQWIKMALTKDVSACLGSQQAVLTQDKEWVKGKEDLFCPGVFEFKMKPGETAAFVVSTAERNACDAVHWARHERMLRGTIVKQSLVRGPLTDALVLAADQFVVSHEENVGIKAGYPCEKEESRQSFMSLPGLCLATNRFDEAGKILARVSRQVDRGIFPNHERLLKSQSVDMPLWFVWAVQCYLKAAHDQAGVRQWMPSLQKIVSFYEHGTPGGIHMDRDGLIVVPDAWHDTADPCFTWMGARTGKPVEIQALWYNALQFMAELDLKFNETLHGYDKLASIARNNFNEKFWNASDHYLYDRIEGKAKDPAVRPHALFAVSMHYEILEEKYFKPMIDTARKNLLTPYGLLSFFCAGPDDGAGESVPPRIAFPLLMGCFLTSYVKAYGSSEETKNQAAAWLMPLLEYFLKIGPGVLPEMVEADPPCRISGCLSYSGSVGEVLRVIWEEGLVL